MWRNSSITFKIASAGGILVLGYCISMILGFYVGIQTERRLNDVSSVIFPASQESKAALTAFNEQIKHYKDAVVTGDAGALAEAQEKAEDVARALSEIVVNLAEHKGQTGEVKQTLTLHAEFSASADKIYKSMTSMAAGGSVDEQLMNQAAGLSQQTEKIHTQLDDLVTGFSKKLHDQLSGIESSTRSQRYINLTAFILVVAVGVALVFWIIVGSVQKPIRDTVEMLRDIAEGEGDLTKRLSVRGMDEIGELSTWFNQFIENLSEVIAQIKQTALEMDDSIKVVAGESMGLSQSTQEQASAVEEVASTIEEITSSIKQNAVAASSGLDITKDMVIKANNSAQISGELVNAMKEISEASRKIGDIIRTVNDVAFQTNLLALNAAVEAARAGEHGKGFSVVAEEVRALAQRSSDAARQIRTLIEDTVTKIASGDKMVAKSGAALSEIREAIENLSNSMEEIAASSNEQADGVDNVSRSVVQIDNVTQKNASTVQQLASMAEKLSIEANTLSESVKKFKVD